MHARQMSAWTYNILTSGIELLPSHYIETNYIFARLQNNYQEEQKNKTRNVQEQRGVNKRINDLEDLIRGTNSEIHHEHKNLALHKADVRLCQNMIEQEQVELECRTRSIRAIKESAIKEYESILRGSETEMQCSVERIESLELCKVRVSNHVQELKRAAINLRDEEDNILECIWNIRIELQQITSLQPSVNGRTKGA
jgi:hypothetical protein